MRPLASLLFALPLLAAPALCSDLSGLWRVEGKLPDGAGYSGWATLSRKGEAAWELTARALRADGSALTWTASGTLQAQRLTLVRPSPGAGVVGSIGGGAAAEPVSAVYEVTQDGRLFTGEVDLPGPEGVSRERYARQAPPSGRFERERVVLRPGESLELAVSLDPAEALPVAFVGGARPTHVVTSRPAPDRVVLVGRAPGTTTLRLRLGAHGPELAALPIEVRAGVTREVLGRVKELAAAGKKPLVIFDLDDTLFDTRSRTLAILRAYPAEPRFQALRLDQIAHGLPETLGNAGFSPAELEGEPAKKVRRFWSQRFFDPESLRLDGTIPGGVDYVKAVVAAGGHPIYLTGRKEDMRALSLEVLRAAGYPEGTLFLKDSNLPGSKEPTPAFKGRITREKLPALGIAVAAFDNEPANSNAFRENLPAEARSVFVDTIYPDDSPGLIEGIDTIADFLD